MADSFSRINTFVFFIKKRGNNLSKLLVLILVLLVSNNLLSKSLIPVHINENLEKRDLAIVNKGIKINNQIVAFNSHLRDVATRTENHYLNFRL
jgi:hypothetical protein